MEWINYWPKQRRDEYINEWNNRLKTHIWYKKMFEMH
jgi:hypothetical protein